MSHKVLKPKKCSLFQFTQTYSNNIMNCIQFFISMKWPTGFLCDHCDCRQYYLVKRIGKTKTSYIFECKHCHKQHSLLSDTIFQSCKLDLFLFFNENKGISAIALCSMLDVNYKTAALLETKCRILMALSNSNKLLNSHYYEADVFTVGAKSKNKSSRASEQQKVSGVLSTRQENDISIYTVKTY